MAIEHPRRGHYLFFFLLAKALARSRFALYSATRLHTLQRVVAKVLILFRTQLLVFFFSYCSTRSSFTLKGRKF